MSDEHNNPQQLPEPPGKNNAASGQDASAAPQPRKLRFTRHFLRISAAIIGVASLLLLVILALAFWYSTTPGFENRVRNIVVTQLEQSTGGHVEVGVLHVNLAQLGIEVDNLTIHGKEAPGQIPYFHADKLVAHLKIIDFFAGKIGLSYLGLTRPTIHIIVYPDGSTNQPTPKAAAPTSASSVSAQIFNLAIDQAQLNDGVFILNARKYRFNVQADNLRANLSYDRLRKRYLGNFAARNILLQRGNAKPVSSRLFIQIDAAPNQIHLDHLTFLTGDSRLNIAGTLNNFAHPQFHGHANGSLDLRVLDPLIGVTGIQSGILHLQAKASGTPANYAVQDTARLDNFLYHPLPHQTVSLSAQSQLMLTQDEIAATNFHAQFTGGGSASGNLHILHWLRTTAAAPAPKPKHTLRWFFLHKKTPPPPTPKPEPPTTGQIHLQFASLPLSTLLHAVSPPQFSDLGFNTNISGPVDAHWITSLRTISATTDLQLAPGNSSAPGDVPVTGKISGSYSFAAGIAQLRTLDLHTPGTQARASGSIGINPSMRGSKITGSVVTHKLAEFDKILAALNVHPQSQPLPFDLHGNAAFHGAITGALTAPDVQGHLDASNVDVAFNTTSTPPAQPVTHSIHVDSAQADLDYSPRHFALSAVTLHAGKATANASLTITGTETAKHTYTLNSASPITGQATLNNATLAQLMPLLGTQVPVTGTLGLQLQLAGTLGNPTGSGHLTVNGGDVYGEPYRDLESSLSLANHSLQATNILYQQVGGQVHGSAQLDLDTQHFHFDLTGSGFHLARVHRLQTPKYPLGGVLDFQSQGSGTLQNPSISANLHLAQLQFADAATGSVDATAQLQNQSLTLDAAAHLNQSLVQLHGQATLTGNDPAQAKLTITNLDLNPLAKTFHISGIASRRPINAIATLQGPLSTPQALSGDIHIQPIALSLANVDVQSTSSIHAALKNGTLTLDPFHIKGTNVDVQADGSIGLTGKVHPIQWHTRGSINMKVAETFSDEITSSGMVTFDVNAGGTIHHPSLNGQATIKDVNLASDDYINGLSRINGTLNFNEGRVELQNVTAYSGGGPIQLSGSATYAAGLYLNVQAVAKGVRVRYPAGVTSMVNAKMQLQGGIQSLLLSGNVQVTHFAVNSTMDLVSIVNSSSAPSLPPNPKSFANRVRLDIHVTSSPSMDFQNSFAKLAGTVDLHIRGTAAQPSILGQITITEGQATLAGTTYQLQRGVIYFNNPIRIEPTIDIDATTRVENYDITIGLHGTPSKLQPVFRSSPPLSEQDIFSLLALGRTQEEQQIYSQQQSQAGINPAANALLGSAINATVSSRIQKLFGGGSVKINPAYVTTSGNATARLTVQQQIAKNFTLTYATNVNSSAQQLIQGKLDITPNLSILAVRDETGVFSLIFTIRKRYK
jgi:translocation and assembly module TamB